MAVPKFLFQRPKIFQQSSKWFSMIVVFHDYCNGSMECNAVECNGMESMECNAVEWIGMDAFWVILVILGRFANFWYLFVIFCVKKTQHRKIKKNPQQCSVS